MFSNLFERIQKMLESFKHANTYMSDLDKYITSKYPQSPAEIEHWIKEYDHQQKGWSL